MTTTSQAPLRLSEILEPEWLEQHLFAGAPDVRVRGATEVWREENTATKVRIELDLEDAGAETPSAICIKGMFDESGSRWLANGTSATESRFYSELAQPLAAAGLHVPECLYTAIDADTGHGLLIMRDLVAEGAQFLTALTPYTADQARDSLGQLARLHVATGRGTPLHDAPVAGINLARLAEQSLIPLETMQELLDGPRGTPLPRELRDAALIHRSLSALREFLADEPTCLVHGDAHSGNLYRHSGGAGIIDWQVVQHGHWAQDVAYHIATALTVEDRRASENSLLAHYLAEREALGDPVPAPARAETQYAAALLYGYYMWAITRRVRQDITIEHVKRLGLALADHHSLAIVGAT